MIYKLTSSVHELPYSMRPNSVLMNTNAIWTLTLSDFTDEAPTIRYNLYEQMHTPF